MERVFTRTSATAALTHRSPTVWLTHHSHPFQYLLSPETIEALRKPTFDVWLWEPNEVGEGPPGSPVTGDSCSGL